MSDQPEKSLMPEPRPGRPRSRYADRDEQVRQNMRLYRARRAAELEALARALDQLSAASTLADPVACQQAASSVAGLWTTGSLRSSVNKARIKRSRAAAVAGT